MADGTDLRALLHDLRDTPRPADDRMLGGVCSGVGRRFGVDPMVVRLAVVVLALANGVGLAMYVGAWVLLPDEAELRAPDGRRGAARRFVAHGPTAERAIAIGMITLGALLLIRQVGLLFPSGLVWSVAVSAAGFSVVWARTSDEGRERWLGLAHGRTTDPVDSIPRGRTAILRAVVGGSLLVVGLVFLFASGGLLELVGRTGLAMVATGVGVAILLGPWIVRLWRDLDDERRQRIRSEERSDMAAHLHDSVLQTLTLIQRHADAPGRARMLARRQERELRAWLFDERAPVDGRPVHLVAALDAVVTDVEDRHEVQVELVVVGGDCPLGRPLDGLVAALREAAQNAARHAGVEEVSVYVEVERDKVTAFVRDRGRGFELSQVEPGRLGIRESIVARMTRHGGRAEVHSTPGEGTEIVLEVAR